MADDGYSLIVGAKKSAWLGVIAFASVFSLSMLGADVSSVQALQSGAIAAVLKFAENWARMNLMV